MYVRIYVCLNVCVYVCMYVYAYVWVFVCTYIICGVFDWCRVELGIICVRCFHYNNWHIATHCNTLQYTAIHCNTLQHNATQCNTLQHIATHCKTLQHTATHCNTLQHTTIHCNILQCHAATHVGAGISFLLQPFTLLQLSQFMGHAVSLQHQPRQKLTLQKCDRICYDYNICRMFIRCIQKTACLWAICIMSECFTVVNQIEKKRNSVCFEIASMRTVFVCIIRQTMHSFRACICEFCWYSLLPANVHILFALNPCIWDLETSPMEKKRRYLIGYADEFLHERT